MSLYLSANKLVSDYGTVGDYLIEWRLGSVSGEAVFISGEGTDPLLQAIHPFEDEVVQSGTLYPVIIYAYFNGQKYTLQPNYGDNYSPDLLQCLELYFVVIDGVNCSSGNNNTDYSHTWTYNGLLDPAINAARTIKFDLNNDGSTKFFAWQFKGYNVVDRLTIKYYHINDINNPDIVTDWKIGKNLQNTNMSVTPKEYNIPSVKVVNNLEQYNHVSGDYLIIEITPRVEEPNNIDTNWELNVKCLSSFDDNNIVQGMRTLDPDTVNMEYDETHCRYTLKYKNLVLYQFPSHYHKYLEYIIVKSSSTLYTINSGTFDIYFDISKKLNTSSRTKYSISNQCLPLNDNLNIKKTGNIITYTFNNQDDYLIYKESYEYITNLQLWNNGVTDTTDFSYYNYCELNDKIANNCGDTSIVISTIFHKDSSVVFDDNNYKFTITLNSITNDIIEENCNSTYSIIDYHVNNINTTLLKSDYEYNTKVWTYSFRGVIFILTNLNVTKKDFTFEYNSYFKELLEAYIPTGWNTIMGRFGFAMSRGFAEITDSNDPINNFRIKMTLKEDGTYYDDANAITVYEISDGVVITPTTTTTTTS